MSCPRLVLTVIASCLPLAAAGALELDIVSAPEDSAIHGVRGNDSSFRCSISADGQHVAFESFAFQLVAGDGNQSRDVFVRDLAAASTERVSVGALGGEVLADADYPAISGSGRYVAFAVAGDLAGLGANLFSQVYLYDRSSGALVLLSRSTGGGYGASSSDTPVINTDGTHVVFQSKADDLVAGDLNGVSDAFVYDIAAGTLTLASVNAAGVQGDAAVFGVDISRDGSVLAFETESTTLDAGDGNGARDVFVKNLATGALQLASVDGTGAAGAEDSYLDDLADDGQSVLFTTANALVAGDGNALTDVYSRRLGAAATVRVSGTLADADGDGAADGAKTSADGRRVVFSSKATNLVAGPDGAFARLFLRDFDAGTLTLLPTGAEKLATVHAMTPSGAALCFASAGSDLDAGDLNGVSDVYVLDIAAGTVQLASRSEAALPTGVGNGDSQHSALSADGRYVVFDSRAADLDLQQDDIAAGRKLYLQDRDTGAIERIAVVPGGVDRDRQNPEISADGRYVVFDSYATNLVAGDDLVGDVFRYDRDSGAILRISEALAGGPGHGDTASVSNDGARVAFVSGSDTLLDAGDVNGEEDVYLWDGGALRRISVAGDGSPADGASRDPRLSGDGGWLVFESQATNLTADAVVGAQSLFLADLDGGALRCISCGHELAIGPADLSDDGTLVVFHALPLGTPAAPFDAPGIYLYDRLAGSVQSLQVPFDWENAYGVETRLSGDGTTLAFTAGISDGDAPDGIGTRAAGGGGKVLAEEVTSLYRFRIDTGEFSAELASAAPAGGSVYKVAIDGSGAHLTASATAALLPAVDGNGHYDVYRVTRTPGDIVLQAPASVDESAGSVAVTLLRSGGSDGLMRAEIGVTPGTALADADYRATGGIAEWLDGESGERTIVVTLVDDAQPEDEERFSVAIATVAGGAGFDAAALEIAVTDGDPPLPEAVFADGFE